MGVHYRNSVARIYRHVISSGQRVLELGCAEGDLLAAVQPREGVGVDFAHEMIAHATARHPQLEFIEADMHTLAMRQRFDVVILSDVVGDLWDVQSVFDVVAELVRPQGRIVMNLFSRMWGIPLGLARRLGLAHPVPEQNWLTVEDIENLLSLADLEVVARRQEILCPAHIPVAAALANRVLVKLWPFRFCALTNLIVARHVPRLQKHASEPTVSVIVPARNEEGNIPNVFARVPQMGGGTELVFVEGGSGDDTYRVIEREIVQRPHVRATLLRQEGVGKGDAVRLGFAKATGDILMVLDADLSVDPETLPRFYEALRSGKADLANGVRLVYPREQRAMRFFNLVGNKSFSLVLTWLIGQPIKDTLCGTKALRRSAYEKIASNRQYFGNFDPFGDFDLILGAARQTFKIADIPVRYRERTYGSTNIQRWKHGYLLIRMAWLAAVRLKFV